MIINNNKIILDLKIQVEHLIKINNLYKKIILNNKKVNIIKLNHNKNRNHNNQYYCNQNNLQLKLKLLQMKKNIYKKFKIKKQVFVVKYKIPKNY